MAEPAIFTIAWWNPEHTLWVPLFAYALDVIAQDPRSLPHPVQAIGKAARFLEKYGNTCTHHPLLAGGVCTLLLCFSAALLLQLFTHLPFPVGICCAIYFSWAGLALGSLLREGRNALALINFAKQHEAVDKDNPNTPSPALKQARQSVAMLVSRDVQTLSADDLYRTLAETLSENFTDGFVAPFFWLCITGPIGLWVYKTISTLDSLWGYKTKQYLYFGRIAARCDDFAAYIPARYAALMLYATRYLVSPRAKWPGWHKVRQDACQLASPNAGWTMAAASWIHGASMGGVASYHGKLIEKPILGPATYSWDQTRLEALIQHMQYAGLASALSLASLTSLLYLFV